MPNRSRKYNQEELDLLANQIGERFIQVSPDPDFVNHLRHNLQTPPEMVLERPDRTGDFLLVFGIASAAILLISLFARMIYGLLRLLKVI